MTAQPTWDDPHVEFEEASRDLRHWQQIYSERVSLLSLAQHELNRALRRHREAFKRLNQKAETR